MNTSGDEGKVEGHKKPRKRKRVSGGGNKVPKPTPKMAQVHRSAITVEDDEQIVDQAEADAAVHAALNVDLPEPTWRENHTLSPDDRATLIVADAHVNDKVIDAFFNLVETYASNRTVKAMPVMLFDKLHRGNKPQKCFSTVDLRPRTILIPCAENDHWTVAIHRPETTVIEWYNSVNQCRVTTHQTVEWVSDRCSPGQALKVTFPHTPQQTNAHDCGVIVCLVALAVGMDRDLNPNWGNHVRDARIWIDLCIQHGTIEDHEVFNHTIDLRSTTCVYLPRPPMDRPHIPAETTDAQSRAPCRATAPLKAPHSAGTMTSPAVSTRTATAPGASTDTIPKVEVSAIVEPTEVDANGEVGDEENDDDQELEDFIAQIKAPKKPTAPPPHYKHPGLANTPREPVATRSRTGIIPPCQEPILGVGVGPTCGACNRTVYGDRQCKTCKRPCHEVCKTYGNCHECFVKVMQTPNPNKKGTEPLGKVSVITGIIPQEVTEAQVKTSTAVAEKEQPVPKPAKESKSGIHNRTRPKAAEIHVHVTTTGTGSDFHNGRKGPSPTVIRASAFLSMKVAEAPQEAMDMAWKGIGEAQRASHQRLLRLLQTTMAEHFDLINLPLPMACIKVLVRVRNALKWGAATMAKHAATMSGALNRLDQYMEGSELPVHLAQYSVWTDFIKETKRQERTQKARVPVAATWADVKRIMESLIHRGKHGTAVMLLIAWTHAARPGDVWKLKKQDIQITDARVTVLWTRGKVVTTRGPYSTFATPGPYHELMTEYLDRIPHDAPLFPGVWKSQQFLKEVRTYDRALELKSLRRGALQCLSAAGYSESILLLFSGHSTVEMLRRYLGYRPAEDVAKQCEMASHSLTRCA